MSIKSLFRKAVNKALVPNGFVLSRRRIENEPLEQLVLAIRHFRIGCIIDVGANAGQFAEDVLGAGYEGKLHSIEPLPQAHAALRKSIRAKPQWSPRWQAEQPFAAGDTNSTVLMQVAGNSLSSSALRMLDAHIAAAPASKPIGSVEVAQRTLDSVFAQRLDMAVPTLLKIDTQGYEHKVLQGAERCLRFVTLVQLELSTLPLYADQALWLDLIEYMGAKGFGAKGFGVWAMHPEFCDSRTGQVLQFNALFFRQ